MLLTTVAKVEHLDDDRFVIYRRQDFQTATKCGYEKVTFDRATRTITSE